MRKQTQVPLIQSKVLDGLKSEEDCIGRNNEEKFVSTLVRTERGRNFHVQVAGSEVTFSFRSGLEAALSQRTAPLAKDRQHQNSDI